MRWLECITLDPLLQVDAQKKRFLFMYYGGKFNVRFFQGKFRLAFVEGSIDERGCHFVFVKTANQIRTSQFHAAINEYNLCVPSSMAMRLQEEVHQPVIVTMNSRQLSGSIYSMIIKDKQIRCDGGTSNYWCWSPDLEKSYLSTPNQRSDIESDGGDRHGISSSAYLQLSLDGPGNERLNAGLGGGFEFDVVKKRRIMDGPLSSMSESDVNTSSRALEAFEDFERHVLPALQLIQADEDANRRLEILQFEDDMVCGRISTAGGVYFAWSECLGCMKIGATRRDNPQQRLRELSRYVTSSFVLSAWLPSPTPFKMEAAAHSQFRDKRINFRNGGSGAGTEFFRISAAEAEAWVACVRGA